MQSNRTHGIRRIAVALCALACIALASCSSDSDSTKASSNSASGSDVQIKLVAFKPATLHIKAGTTVTWHQTDPGVHTVTSGTVQQATGGVDPKPDGKFASGQLATGKTFAHRFNEAGTFSYFCEIHPATMRGEITVS